MYPVLLICYCWRRRLTSNGVYTYWLFSPFTVFFQRLESDYFNRCNCRCHHDDDVASIQSWISCMLFV